MPTVFVAFGVTGDLMAQKILPGLFALHDKGDLPKEFKILGVSRRDWDDRMLRNHVERVLESHDALGSFLERFTFVRGDVGDDALYPKLADMIGEREAVLYYSLSPALYQSAFEKLASSALANIAPRLRLMIEKPFGMSEKSAKELQMTLSNIFGEQQIFRVDHYLAKESLIYMSQHPTDVLKRVSVHFLETAGVEKRGEFYDATGALRDVGQNHVLEMFARAMQSPSRAEALEELHTLLPHEMEVQVVRGQYEGYTLIPGVARGSRTETYFKIETAFRGVPVVFEGGKRLGLNRKEVVLTYHDGSEHLISITDNRERSEYERLILECLNGRQDLFVSMREVIALWRFVDPVLRFWKEDERPPKQYPIGAEEVI